MRFFQLDCVSMAFDLLWRFDVKKKTKKKKKKKLMCLFDIRYSFRFEKFIIPLKVE